MNNFWTTTLVQKIFLTVLTTRLFSLSWPPNSSNTYYKLECNTLQYVLYNHPLRNCYILTIFALLYYFCAFYYVIILYYYIFYILYYFIYYNIYYVFAFIHLSPTKSMESGFGLHLKESLGSIILAVVKLYISNNSLTISLTNSLT